MRVGLTGGIGSGKSTVARLLAQRGAVIVDADQVAREVVEPGQPALAEIAARFGAQLIRGDGSLDRAGLAAIVFADGAALADLDAIMHPRIAHRVAERFAEAQAQGAQVMVYDMPLLVENGLARQMDLVVVVSAPEAVRVARLAARGMGEADARARMAHQATDAQREAAADIVLDNGGTPEQLEEQVGRAWATIRAPRDRQPMSDPPPTVGP